jgi:protein-tyrosine phosphatase
VTRRRPAHGQARDDGMTHPVSAHLTRLDPDRVRLAVAGATRRLAVHAAANPFAPPAPEPLLLLDPARPADLAWPQPVGRAGVVLAGAGAPRFVAERHVAFERILNCRDLGGYAAVDGRSVRWGHLFRSADLSAASPRDVEALAALGLGLVCDFRTAEEARAKPDRLPARHCAYQNFPLHQSAMSSEDAAAIRSGSMAWFESGGMTRIYLGWIGTCAPVWAGLLARLAQEDNEAVLFHCMAGKDRTGVFAALLLALLGVADEDILADHQLSNRAIRELGAAAELQADNAGDKAAFVLPGLPAPAEALRDFLASIRAEFGTVADYLQRQGGLEAACIPRLRNRFLE